MEIDNLQNIKQTFRIASCKLANTTIHSVVATYLVATLVANEHYERAMILLDIVVDEDWNPRVKLFSHSKKFILERT